MSITRIIRPLLTLRRQRQLDLYASKAPELQMEVLKHLIGKGIQTEWGQTHHYEDAMSYEAFASQTPVNT